jgi:anti-sigma factor (TIGR02949 family)
MTRELMRCEEALRLLAAHLDGELDSSAVHDLEQHLARCRSCYSRAEFERRLKTAIAELGSEPARPALQQRIRDLVAGFAVADR